MGITKALMEKLAVAKSRVAVDRGCLICATRYGNIMGSRGSVIPLFIDQIKAGQPLTITDPTMTRFMMSIDGAVDLVLYAFEHAQPGDLFVQKAPAATIETLALALKRLFRADNPVRVIGTRHGEKKYETLLTREERLQAVDLGDYYRVPGRQSRSELCGLLFRGQPARCRRPITIQTTPSGWMSRRLAELLAGLDFVQQELATWTGAPR